MYALQQLENHLKEGACVLDVGSGSGYLTAAMAYMVIGSNLCLGSTSVLHLFTSFLLFKYCIVYYFDRTMFGSRLAKQEKFMALITLIS